MKKLLTSISLAFIFLSCTTESKKQISINLEELTIDQIHQAYQNGEYTSEQLVQAYLRRIEELDSGLNAITYINREALDIARSLDEEFKKTSKIRPLHGIPVIVKDNVNVNGLPTTAGSNALENFYPAEDAFIIQKLKAAGAIVLAKSNMAEWAFSPMHSESSTHGTTHNPYNLDYVPAGSSGGTGASIAANFGIIGIGTDTGNSIRGPSSHCALVGFRTTLGLISRSGIVPLFLRNDVVGPMCRTVADATKMMEVMAGYDSADQITSYGQGKIENGYQKYLIKEGLREAKIGVLRQIIDDNADSEVVDLFNQSIKDLKTLGAQVIDSIYVSDFEALSESQWCGTFKKDLSAFLQVQVKSDTMKSIEDVIKVGTKSAFAEKRLTAYASASGRWGKSEAECGDAYTDSRRIAFRNAIRSVMDSLGLDAIIYPSWNNPPARIEFFEEEYAGDNNQVISPHTGQPAFTVPMGYLSNNLPAGLQFLGRMYDEGTLIKLCYAYEQGTKHRKPPVLK